jgi:hypothetical protein
VMSAIGRLCCKNLQLRGMSFADSVVVGTFQDLNQTIALKVIKEGTHVALGRRTARVVNEVDHDPIS